MPQKPDPIQMLVQMPIRAEAHVFALAMEERLRSNDVKGGWDYLDATLLLARLLEEAGELARELRHIEQVSPTPEEAMQVRKEAADVANYAMMIADNYGDLKAIREAHSRLFSGPME